MTTFLATVLGWYLVIFSCVLLFRREAMHAILTDFANSRASVFILAVITTILGLMMVVSHSIWVMGWPVVVTVLGWLILVSSILRMVFLDAFTRRARAFLSHPKRMIVFGIVVLALGVFLLFHVYFG